MDWSSISLEQLGVSAIVVGILWLWNRDLKADNKELRQEVNRLQQQQFDFTVATTQTLERLTTAIRDSLK